MPDGGTQIPQSSRRPTRTVRPPRERFEEKIEKHDADCACCAGCWHWKGRHDASGYARFDVSNADKHHSGHRLAYEWFVGEIPTGLEIDHTCRNRGCLNPAHLEAVTRAENNRRMHAARGNRCRRGHLLVGLNAIQRSDGFRQCRMCKRASDSRYHAARKATPDEAARDRGLSAESEPVAAVSSGASSAEPCGAAAAQVPAQLSLEVAA